MIFRSVFPNIGEIILTGDYFDTFHHINLEDRYQYLPKKNSVVGNGIENAIKVHDKNTWHVLYEGQNNGSQTV